MTTYTEVIEGRTWRVEVLDPMKAPEVEWGTPNNHTTYRDYELAAMVTTYHEGEPVVPEQPVVSVGSFPAAWDIPIGEGFNQTYLDFTKLRGSGGNYPDRRDAIEALTGEVQEDVSNLSISVWCPVCGGTLLESYDFVVCDVCEYTNADHYYQDVGRPRPDYSDRHEVVIEVVREAHAPRV